MSDTPRTDAIIPEHLFIVTDADFMALVNLARQLERDRAELLEALKEIAAIEDRMYGGDWDEIEDARKIARAAIAKAEKEPT